MLFCKNCGEIIDNNTKKCPACGFCLNIQTNVVAKKNQEEPALQTNNHSMIYMIIGSFFIILVSVACILLFNSTSNDRDNLKVKKSSEQASTAVKTVTNTMNEILRNSQSKSKNTDIDNLLVDSISTSAFDCDYVSDYNYKPLQLPGLFTDIMQLGGYSIQQQLAEATKISIEKENHIGDLIEQELANGIFKGRINNDRKTALYLQQLGQFLAKKVNRKGINYKFFLLDDNKFNALSFPGGRIYIFTGLLKYISNEAELATIIAHEIKHVDLRHTIALYQIAMKIQGTDTPSDFILFMEKIAQHPYSGAIEADADRKGLELAYSYGYSPFQIVEFWRKLAGKKSNEKISNQLEFILVQATKELNNVISTHPDEKKRYMLLQNHTIELLQKYHRTKFYVGRWNFMNKIPMYKQIH